MKKIAEIIDELVPDEQVEEEQVEDEQVEDEQEKVAQGDSSKPQQALAEVIGRLDVFFDTYEDDIPEDVREQILDLTREGYAKLQEAMSRLY